uniref:Kinesin motor domain-containing protein n=1 Tax=Sander lucioperca TaxID=283035 RepID=A0A8C9YWK4_SANLU
GAATVAAGPSTGKKSCLIDSFSHSLMMLLCTGGTVIEELEKVSGEKSLLEKELSDLKKKYKDRETELQTLKLYLFLCLFPVQTTLGDRESEISCLKDTIHSGEMERRQLHNTIQELKGNIRVFCRVRPLVDGGLSEHIQLPVGNKRIRLVRREKSHTGGPDTQKNFTFNFDRVFGPQASQHEVFEEISPLVQSALDGYNVCVFAYGQTGSGKTFTMEGSGEDGELSGIIPKAQENIFNKAEKLGEQGWEFTFTASFMEVYNETLRDLLFTGKKRPNHLIKRQADKVTITNLKYVKVSNKDQVLGLIKTANQNRATAETSRNERSSRSHFVFQMEIQGVNVGRGIQHNCEYNLANYVKIQNVSLSQLATVINALAKKVCKQQHLADKHNAELERAAPLTL